MEEDKRLKEALDEQMNRELSQIPSEEEIRKQHTFHDSFLIYMQKLISIQKRKKQNQSKILLHQVFKVAACLVCVIGIGTLMFTMLPLGAGSGDKSAPLESSEESMDEAREESIIESDEAKNEAKQEQEPEYFSLLSTSYDGEYHIEVCINNMTNKDMTYSPIYKWSYTVDGETTETIVDVDFDKSKMKLEPEGYITEAYDLADYGISKSGGVLNITRMINEAEYTISFELED